MKFKTDENLGLRCVTFLRSAGHDAITVREQGLAGAEDEKIFEVCAAERRILLTLDHDFGNVLHFQDCEVNFPPYESDEEVAQR